MTFNRLSLIIGLFLKYILMLRKDENFGCLWLLVTGRNARTFRDLSTAIAMRFMIGTTEQISLVATFTLAANKPSGREVSHLFHTT
jgi:hypothetical protein